MKENSFIIVFIILYNSYYLLKVFIFLTMEVTSGITCNYVYLMTNILSDCMEWVKFHLHFISIKTYWYLTFYSLLHKPRFYRGLCNVCLFNPF